MERARFGRAAGGRGSVSGGAVGLRVALLGPVRAWVGEREVELGSSRQRGVFTVLALRAGAAVRRDELIRGVWGDDAPATAGGSVHTYVSVLRKALEPDRPRGTPPRLLESSGSGYRLRLEAADSDVAAFAALRERAREQLAAEEHRAALRTLDEALALWRGTALSGLDGPFARARRASLGEARSAAREARAEAALALGEHGDVIGELGALVAEEPLRERARELLALALHRAGRSAEALEVLREARRVLRDELGVDPGPGLRAARDLVLRDHRAGPGQDPPQAAAIPRPRRGEADHLVGRDEELRVARELIGATSSGRGRVLWVEGEMGIGKSSLLAAVTALASNAGHRVAHGVADELGTRFPLRLAMDCLDVDVRSPDPRRAATARALRDERPPSGSVFTAGDPIAAAVERLGALVERLCGDGPLTVVMDDLQWADESSTELWHRLTGVARRQPLLLVGAARPVPHRVDVARLRRDAEAGGAVLDLLPLTDSAVTSVVGELVGAAPGPGLRRVAARAGGNPLYVREVADALVRERAVLVSAGIAEVAPDVLDRTPVSLVSAVADRLDFLTDPTRQVLRWAALLGGEFSVEDLSVVLARPVPDLLGAFTEAVAAGVLRDAGSRMAFRHPVIRQALYEGTPSALRTALHQQAARALAESGAPAEHVAGQLMAAAGEVDAWAVRWVVGNAQPLGDRAPLVAVELLQRCLASPRAPQDTRSALAARLSSVLFRVGRDAEAEEHARRALPGLRDADQVAKARWTLAYVPYRASRPRAALAELREALADPVLTDTWRARLLSLLSLVQRAGVGDLDQAAVSARQAIAVGERAGDPFAIGQALEVLWQVEAVRRDYARAVGYLDQALDVVGTDVALADLRLVLLDNRVFTLQCLDRLDEAGQVLEQAFRVAGPGTPVAGLQVASAVHGFWLGDWDGAVARLGAVMADAEEFTGFGLREGGPVLLLHGVAALIAAHRDDGAALAAHLAAGANLPLVTAADRENCDFLVAAEAMGAARAGDEAGAVQLLGAILDTRFAQMMLRHQWLPDLVRLALACGDRATAREAVEACEAEAARESTTARAAAAARRCRCVLEGDADGLAEVAGHYRRAGRVFELGQTLEDRAVLLAGRSGVGAAERGAALGEALAAHEALGARWDVRRLLERAGGD